MTEEYRQKTTLINTAIITLVTTPAAIVFAEAKEEEIADLFEPKRGG